MVKFRIFDELNDPSAEYINRLIYLIVTNDTSKFSSDIANDTTVLYDTGIWVQESCYNATYNRSCDSPIIRPTLRLSPDQLCPSDKPIK